MEETNFYSNAQNSIHPSLKAKVFETLKREEKTVSLSELAPLASQDLVNFKSEFNIGLALPFEFCKSKKAEKIKKSFPYT